MKRLVTALAAFGLAVLVLAGCSDNTKTEEVSAAELTRNQVIENSSAAARQLQGLVSDLKGQNERMSSQLSTLQRDALAQDLKIAELERAVEALSGSVSAAQSQLAAEAAAQPEDSSGPGIWRLLLLLIILVAIIYFIWRLIRPKPFDEDDDDDFSSFDDDFGFDDEDEEDMEDEEEPLADDEDDADDDETSGDEEEDKK